MTFEATEAVGRLVIDPVFSCECRNTVIPLSGLYKELANFC